MKTQTTRYCWLCEHNDDGPTPAVKRVQYTEHDTRRAHWLCADCARIVERNQRVAEEWQV